MELITQHWWNSIFADAGTWLLERRATPSFIKEQYNDWLIKITKLKTKLYILKIHKQMEKD